MNKVIHTETNKQISGSGVFFRPEPFDFQLQAGMREITYKSVPDFYIRYVPVTKKWLWSSKRESNY